MGLSIAEKTNLLQQAIVPGDATPVFASMLTSVEIFVVSF
jgi:hypothetical protein